MLTLGAIAALTPLVAPPHRRAAAPTGRGRSAVRGMTLVEILVVLALLVVIGGLVVPVFTGSVASVRLRRAGDQVVTGWSRARAEAIESGQPYQFRFKPDTGTFVIEPWTGLLGTESSSTRSTTPGTATSTTTTTSTATAATATASSSTISNAALPEEIIFQRGELAVEDFQSGERSVASLQDAGESLSTPILFFPDGTASDASILLTNGKKQFVRVTLRGLTGVGRASEVLTEAELQRADRRK
jgi:Tfp pilus assembly protein FimT